MTAVINSELDLTGRVNTRTQLGEHIQMNLVDGAPNFRKSKAHDLVRWRSFHPWLW